VFASMSWICYFCGRASVSNAMPLQDAFPHHSSVAEEARKKGEEGI
jgi:hypothetical protein